METVKKEGKINKEIKKSVKLDLILWIIFWIIFISDGLILIVFEYFIKINNPVLIQNIEKILSILSFIYIIIYFIIRRFILKCPYCKKYLKNLDSVFVCPKCNRELQKPPIPKRP